MIYKLRACGYPRPIRTRLAHFLVKCGLGKDKQKESGGKSCHTVIGVLRAGHPDRQIRIAGHGRAPLGRTVPSRNSKSADSWVLRDAAPQEGVAFDAQMPRCQAVLLLLAPVRPEI